MGRPKKIKATEMKQVNGRSEPPREVDTSKVPFKSIDEIFGFDKLAPYKTHDEEVYIKTLKELNVADLQKECAAKGLMPKDSRKRMEEELLNKFRRHNAMVLNPGNVKKAPYQNLSQEVRDILSEGGNKHQ